MTAYLAPVSYYSQLARHETPHCDPRLLSRCRIASPQGPLTLSIPLRHTHHGADIRDIRISEHARWRHRHWNALRSAYSRSPYFQFYEDDLAPLYEIRWDFLADLNETLHQLLCQLLGISPEMTGNPQRGFKKRSRGFSEARLCLSERNRPKARAKSLLNLPSAGEIAKGKDSLLACSASHSMFSLQSSALLASVAKASEPRAKRSFAQWKRIACAASSPEGNELLAIASEAKIPPVSESEPPAPCPYTQVFSQQTGFMPDLSIVDLLFNMGPESVLYL